MIKPLTTGIWKQFVESINQLDQQANADQGQSLSREARRNPELLNAFRSADPGFGNFDLPFSFGDRVE